MCLPVAEVDLRCTQLFQRNWGTCGWVFDLCISRDSIGLVYSCNLTFTKSWFKYVISEKITDKDVFKTHHLFPNSAQANGNNCRSSLPFANTLTFLFGRIGGDMMQRSDGFCGIISLRSLCLKEHWKKESLCGRLGMTSRMSLLSLTV